MLCSRLWPCSPDAHAVHQGGGLPGSRHPLPLLFLRGNVQLCRCSRQYHCLPRPAGDSVSSITRSSTNPTGLGWNVPKMPYRGTSSGRSRKPAVWAGSHGPSPATTCTVEPFLYLWGICLTEDAFDPMELLIAARKRFESNLPVERPYTEPDIMIHLPGRYLILIEAKFTSPNTTYASEDRGRMPNR